MPTINGLKTATHYFGDKRGGVDGQPKQQREEFWCEGRAAAVVKALEHGPIERQGRAACDRKDAERRREPAKRVGKVGDVSGIVVHVVAGQRDEIRACVPHRLSDVGEVAAGGMRADVKVGNLRDAHAVQSGREIDEMGIEGVNTKPS